MQANDPSKFPDMNIEMEPMPPPITDEDVAAVNRRLAKLDIKVMNEIFNTYIQQVKSLVNTAVKMLDPEEDEDQLVELERVKRLVNFLPADECFIRSKDKIWWARKQILRKNAGWFLNRDYSNNIKKDHKQAMIETIIRAVQEKFPKMTTEEQDLFWTKGIQMLQVVAKYKKVSGEQ